MADVFFISECGAAGGLREGMWCRPAMREHAGSRPCSCIAGASARLERAASHVGHKLALHVAGGVITARTGGGWVWLQ